MPQNPFSEGVLRQAPMPATQAVQAMRHDVVQNPVNWTLVAL